MLAQNEERMKVSWSLTIPIEVLCKKLQDGTEFSEEGGTNMVERTIIILSCTLIHNTGDMNEACRT